MPAPGFLIVAKPSQFLEDDPKFFSSNWDLLQPGNTPNEEDYLEYVDRINLEGTKQKRLLEDEITESQKKTAKIFAAVNFSNFENKSINKNFSKVFKVLNKINLNLEEIKSDNKKAHSDLTSS